MVTTLVMWNVVWTEQIKDHHCHATLERELAGLDEQRRHLMSELQTISQRILERRGVLTVLQNAPSTGHNYWATLPKELVFRVTDFLELVHVGRLVDAYPERMMPLWPRMIERAPSRLPNDKVPARFILLVAQGLGATLHTWKAALEQIAIRGTIEQLEQWMVLTKDVKYGRAVVALALSHVVSHRDFGFFKCMVNCFNVTADDVAINNHNVLCQAVKFGKTDVMRYMHTQFHWDRRVALSGAGHLIVLAALYHREESLRIFRDVYGVTLEDVRRCHVLQQVSKSGSLITGGPNGINYLRNVYDLTADDALDAIEDALPFSQTLIALQKIFNVTRADIKDRATALLQVAVRRGYIRELEVLHDNYGLTLDDVRKAKVVDMCFDNPNNISVFTQIRALSTLRAVYGLTLQDIPSEHVHGSPPNLRQALLVIFGAG